MQKKIFCALLLTAAGTLAGTDKTASGFALHAGFGSLYGGLGVSAEYQFRLLPLLVVTPFASFGAATPIEGGDFLYRPGYCLGGQVEFGRSHRVFIGPSFGTQYIQYDEDQPKVYTNLRTIVGPAIAGGYKGTARFGLMWQVYGGACLLINESEQWRNTAAPVFGLGLGYKF